MADSKVYQSLFDDDDFETEEDQALDEELQRVVQSYRPRSARASEDSAPSAATSSRQFADASNLPSSITYLTSSLSAFGFPSELPLTSGKPEDAAKVCNVLYALLAQRQRDVERHRDMEDGLARAESSLQVASQARQRMEARLLVKEKEIGSLENKLRTTESLGRTESARLGSEVGDLHRSNVDLQRRHTQFQHELRRRDREFERLQAKLHDVLTEKKREAKANSEAASRLIENGSRPSAVRRDDEFFKRVVSSYEEKQREVLLENRDLRSALESLQAEHRAVTNQQVQRAQQLATVKRTVQGEFAAELSDLSALGAEAKLRAKLEALQHATDLLNEDSSSAASAQHEGGSRSALETKLLGQIRAARRLLADHEALARLAIDGMARAGREEGVPLQDSNSKSRGGGGGAQQEAAAAASSPTVRRLEEEYRLKVVELESKVATAQMQGKGLNGSEDSFMAQFEEERRRVDDARLALVEEKARIAKALEQQGEKLQQEAFDLGQAKWEFENTRAAFQDTMRQFAPGFGAGTFLAKAIAKRSALAAKERSNEEQATAAGRRAAEAVKVANKP